MILLFGFGEWFGERIDLLCKKRKLLNMFIHYLKIAFRNIRKYALQNMVSIIGLATGFVAFALSSLWMGYVDSYDTYHKDVDRIYTFSFYEDGKTMVGRYGGRLAEGNLIDELFRTYQERGQLDSLGLESIMYYHQESESMDNMKKTCLCIDSVFIDYFNPTLVAGDLSFLDNPGKIAVSCSFAHKEYGDDNPIAKELRFRSKMYTIGAVVEDFDHSFLEFEMLRKGDMLFNHSNKLFFKLQKGLTVQDMLDKWEKALETFMPQMSMDYLMRGKTIVPLREVYKTIDENDEETFVKYNGLDLFSKASLLILICAIVNHFTFFLNYLRGRRREMILRKVNGASTGSIAIQMVTESTIPVLMALLVGLLAALLLKRPYMELADIGMTDSYYLKGSIIIMLIVMAVSILIGLSEVILMNQKTMQSGISLSNNDVFRKISVGIQITSGMMFMFTLIAMFHQFSYMQNLNWGTQKKDVAVVFLTQDYNLTDEGKPYWGDMLLEDLESRYGLKERISAIPCVTGVYLNYADISISRHYGNMNGISAQGVRDYFHAEVFDYIYPGLIDRLGLTVLDGAIPQEGLTDDEIIITENLLKAMGGTCLDDLPPVYLTLSDSARATKPFSIVAVVKNIHLDSYDETPPFIILCGFHNRYLVPEFTYGSDRAGGSMWGELSVQYIPGTKEKFESSFKELMDGLGIEYKIEYPTERFFEHLSKDRHLSTLLLILCITTILIALFGIWSQITLTCTERKREIAIRKAHGAKVSDILNIFAREYGVIFLISSAIAFASGFLVMHHWLQQFYYRATVSWWIYLSVLIFTALVIVATVINRVLTTARENPAEVIKSE